MGNILSVKELTVKYGNRIIIENISLSVKTGETAVIIGESGSGKTVTTSAIMGLLSSGLQITSGTITGGGRGDIGIIMQNPASCFDSLFTVKSHFIETFKAVGKGKPSDNVLAEIIGQVGLNPTDVLNSYPFQLSGGMLQRLMIALTLAMDTKFIIADEPSSDLDSYGQKEILQLIKSLQKSKGFGMVFITHDLALASTVGDKVYVMKAGKIVEEGQADKILRNPQHDYTKALIAANRSLYNTPWGIFGESHEHIA